MKKTAVIFIITLVLTAVLLFSCGGGGGGGVDNAMEDNSFSISYIANGAESGTVPAAQQGNGKEVLSISANISLLEKGGYFFDGWNTSSDGSGIDYAPGALYNGKNLTLYAKWIRVLNYDVINPGSPAQALDGVQRTLGVSTATITGLTDRGMTLSNINIPKSIDGYPVSSIGDNAFQNCDNLAYVTIPNTVTTIGDYAFADCNSLWTISISESVSTIGNGVFLGCNQLSNILMQRTSPPSMGSNVFVGCDQVFVSVPLAAIDIYNSDPNWNTLSISTPGSFCIIYKGNGADSGEVPSQQRGMAGDVVQISGNVKTLARAGCSFNGWNTKADGTGISFAPDANYSFSYEQGDLFLYAQWQHPDYIVSFDSRGADTSASPERITVKAPANTIKSLPSQPYKQYYNFAGWYLNQEGEGEQFVVGSPVTNNMTVYAKWTKGIFYVNYHSDKHSSGTVPATQYAEIGTPVIISGNTGNMHSSAYRFEGWKSSRDGTVCAIGSQYSGPENLYLDANWLWLDSQICYFATNSTSGNAPGQQVGAKGDTIILHQNTGNLARTGYTFGGWNTKADGSGIPYAEGESYLISKYQTNEWLYPNWIPNPHTVTYNSNKADSGSIPSAQECVYDQQISIQTNIGNLERDGYRFVGWNTSADGRGTHFAPGTSYTVKGNAILYAEWSCRVTYNGNENTSGAVPDVQHGGMYESIVVPDNVGNLERTGYRFGGWNTKSDGSGRNYEEGASYTITGDVTLYAKWLPIYTIIFNSNGATSGYAPSNQEGVYGDQFPIKYKKGNLKKTGYIITGWNTEADGSGTTYYDGQDYTIKGNATLYAKWLPLYTITYDSNGATSGSGPEAQEYVGTNGEQITLRTNTGSMERDGYVLIGWNTKADGSGTDYALGANYTITGDATLYAKWLALLYTYTSISGNRDGINIGNIVFANGKTCAASLYSKYDYYYKNSDGAPVGVVAYQGTSSAGVSGMWYMVQVDYNSTTRMWGGDTTLKTTDNGYYNTYTVIGSRYNYSAENYPAFGYAIDYHAPNSASGDTYYSGWFLPSLNELELVNSSRSTINTTICALEDKGVNGVHILPSSGAFWSSSQWGTDTGSAGLFDFGYGGRSRGFKTSLIHVVVVRTLGN